jgi:hypothetical protein
MVVIILLRLIIGRKKIMKFCEICEWNTNLKKTVWSVTLNTFLCSGVLHYDMHVKG